MTHSRGKWIPGTIRPGGWALLITAVLLLAAAWNTGINLLYVVFGMTASLLILSSLFLRLSFRGVCLARECPPAVHRGDPVPVTLRILNGKRFFSALSVRVVQSIAARPPAHTLGYVLRIPPRKSVSLTITQNFPRRGVHQLPPYDLVSAFPFGLTERRRRYADHQEIVVYPRVHPVRTRALDQAQGGRLAVRCSLAEGGEFFSLREYEPGDEIRYIAWRLSARLGVWMVRELAVEQARRAAIILDTRWSPLAEDEQPFEDAVELAASLAISLLHRQYNVAIITPGAETPMATGTAQHRRILELLARVTPAAPEDHPGFETSAMRKASQDARILVISPDAQLWGKTIGPHGVRILHPEEVVHA